MRNTVDIIGIDPYRDEQLGEALFEDCALIVLTERFWGFLPQSIAANPLIELCPIAPLSKALTRIEEVSTKGKVIVLASGDPLFFGIGKSIIDRLGRDQVSILPAVSSVQHAFSRFKLSWGSAVFRSLHGRKHANPVGLMVEHPLTALLTDQVNTPESLARKLAHFFAGSSDSPTLYVAQDLGTENERITVGPPDEIAENQFPGLCCLVVEHQTPVDAFNFSLGLTETDIAHSRGLITKSEVRAAALHLLTLPRYGVLWDVGAGSGSIGLEAARMCPGTTVYSVEKKSEGQANILKNKADYGVMNLKMVPGPAPEMLIDLPHPDRVFIGGSGGVLSDIVDHCLEKLKPGGRIVISAVLEKTREEAPQLLHERGLEVTLHHVQVARSTYPATQNTSFNPITLIVGKKGHIQADS